MFSFGNALLRKIASPTCTVIRFTRRWISSDSFIFSEEVKKSLNNGSAVVALESTIITHGLPFPSNYETAVAVEDVIRSTGCTPATIAIMNGKIHIGLTDTELRYLSEPSTEVTKASRRDLPVVLAKKWNGSTTVAATMILAERAKIPVFVTGGIGGVHRGAESTMDVSADLTELGRTPVAVVCAGAKSILDIPRTLEYLETQGVSVINFGDSLDFPAFYCRKSYVGETQETNKSMSSSNDPQEIAKMISANQNLELGSGLVVATPIPSEAELDSKWIDDIIREALANADSLNIKGKLITPFILDYLAKRTEGKTVAANKSLILNNAQKGGEIAYQLSQLNNPIKATNESPPVAQSDVVIIGASIVDIIAKCDPSTDHVQHTSNPGTVRNSYGGVARNIAVCAGRMHADPLFISVCGDDVHGNNMVSEFRSLDIKTEAILKSKDIPTAIYCAILDHTSNLLSAVADCTNTDHLTEIYLKKFEEHLKQSKIVCIDANLTSEAIKYICDVCHKNNVPVWFEPTSVAKCVKPIEVCSMSKIGYTSPNAQELETMVSSLKTNVNADCLKKCTEFVTKCVSRFQQPKTLKLQMEDVFFLSYFCPTVFVTLGEQGLLVLQNKSTELDVIWMANKPSENNFAIHDVTGAGDSLVGGCVSALAANKTLRESMKVGMACAIFSLQSSKPVSELINRCNVDTLAEKMFEETTITISLD